MQTQAHAKRRRLTAEERRQAERDALLRARTGNPCQNDAIVIMEFQRRGIVANPREDVFTFLGWRALGRVVKKGEHGVRLTTYAPRVEKDPETREQRETRRPVVTHVFHVSQTAPLQGRD